jgi:hypothetical protein
MNARNARIANRVIAGQLIIDNREKVILHHGTNKTCIRVRAYGKVYASKAEASRALGKSGSYIQLCIKYGWYSGDIFEITDEL